MPISCPLVAQRNPYERTVVVWADAREDLTLQLSARLTDHLVDLTGTLIARPAPDYEVLAAEATASPAATWVECADLIDRFKALQGARIVPGFRRTAATLLGDHALAGRFLDAVIEAARLSRQVTQTPSPLPTNLSARDFHRLDVTIWPELVDTCFTYRTESDALFTQRAVATTAVSEAYSSPPGKRLIFHRYKRTRLALSGELLSLYQSMFDQVHFFELWYELDVERQQVLDVKLLTPRLPYTGLCEEPQRKLPGLIGARLDQRWAEMVRSTVGGREGCFQLTDLTSDLFHFLRFP